MVRMKMAETLREAVTFVEQAHIRVGVEVVTDPAFLVTRNLEGKWLIEDSHLCSTLACALDTFLISFYAINLMSSSQIM